MLAAARQGIVATMVKRSVSSKPLADLSALKTLKVERQAKPWVAHVVLNRPDKRNALSLEMFDEIRATFDDLHRDGNCRAIVLSGAGKIFCAGIDLQDLVSFGQLTNSTELDTARKAWRIREAVVDMQDCLASLDRCRKPVIACIHKACIGAGLDLVSGADIRYGTADSTYSIREAHLGLADDVGSIHRFMKVVGNQGTLRELAYTAREFPAEEALQIGVVSRVLPDEETLLKAAFETAELIASKSPVAVQGTKLVMNHGRDTSIQAGLEYVANWNSAMLQSEDVVKSAMASMAKETPVFSKL